MDSQTVSSIPICLHGNQLLHAQNASPKNTGTGTANDFAGEWQVEVIVLAIIHTWLGWGLGNVQALPESVPSFDLSAGCLI